MGDKVFFDTNILVYAHDRGCAEKRARSQELIFDALRNGTGVLSPQVLGEFFVTATRKLRKPLSIEQARNEVELLSVMATVDLDATLVLLAIDNKARWWIGYWDALVLSAAERAGCAIVYSEDLSDGRRYGSVTVRCPW